MSKRYTRAEKDCALDLLVDHPLKTVSEMTGVPVPTLRNWQTQHREQRVERLLERIETLHEQLAVNAVQIARALEPKIADAPLNQLSSALGAVIDRYLKIDDYLAETLGRSGEHVVRIEYQYPDGTIHDAPPWAEDDSTGEVPASGGGVWPPLREDDAGHDHDHRGGPGRGDDLVAGPHVYDGGSGVAGPQNGFAHGPSGDD